MSFTVGIDVDELAYVAWFKLMDKIMCDEVIL